MIDAQLEYVTGKIPVPGWGPALEAVATALERARGAGVPVIHVVHHNSPGAPIFDPNGPFVAIAPDAAPLPGEPVVIKRTINSFAGTTLASLLADQGVRTPVFAGFVTHNCVSTAVRAALDHGYESYVVADATASRPLPDEHSGLFDAAIMQRASLIGLTDRYAELVLARNLWR